MWAKCYEYLLSKKAKLENRKDSRKKRGDLANKWFGLIRFSPLDVIESPKILTPVISKNNKFCIDVGNNAFLGAAVTAIIPKNTNLYYLCSILNSTTVEWALHQICPIKQGGYYTYSNTFLSELPIRRVSFSTPDDERRRLVEELKCFCAAGEFERVLERVEDCLPKDDTGQFVAEAERSDVVHDLLAYLAEEMIRMNKEKQEEIRGFLNWLEGDIGAKVDDLSNKTMVQSYYGYEFGDLLAVLKKNKRKLKEDYSTRKPQERVKREFENSIATLKPLLSRIKETDDLIDRVVYKLYGLTEEEIEIVKGA